MRFAVLMLVVASLCGCARGEIGGQLRGAAGSKSGLAAIAAVGGATEAVFRFDLQVFEWTVGSKSKQ